MTHAKSVTAQRRPEGNSASGKAHGKTLARLCNSASPRVEPTGLSSDGYRGQLVVGAGGGGGMCQPLPSSSLSSLANVGYQRFSIKKRQTRGASAINDNVSSQNKWRGLFFFVCL
ncbi:SORF2 protein [Gallid alphaherpesvirus 3]|uniref:SORF2 protein n=1 Tax=Gallid alphaherpesvirus 3 TaxID=35250 RepID=F8TC78_9ALPH|nr:SORF2 protein [Gallid alphaherpesvirus 3]AEI00289.1 SORF2 protein [Gallid alphaherpesvirus 3]QEY02301.1 SORF2 protein [Gallid alphaherpesvirus 3]